MLSVSKRTRLLTRNGKSMINSAVLRAAETRHSSESWNLLRQRRNISMDSDVTRASGRLRRSLALLTFAGKRCLNWLGNATVCGARDEAASSRRSGGVFARAKRRRRRSPDSTSMYCQKRSRIHARTPAGPDLPTAAATKGTPRSRSKAKARSVKVARVPEILSHA